MTRWMQVDGRMIKLENTTEYLQEAGRYRRIWHRYVKGWSELMGRWVTFCLGIAKVGEIRQWLRSTGQTLAVEARILMSRILGGVAFTKETLLNMAVAL